MGPGVRRDGSLLGVRFELTLKVGKGVLAGREGHMHVVGDSRKDFCFFWGYLVSVINAEGS